MTSAVDDFKRELISVKNLNDLFQLKAQYLGKKGYLTAALKTLGELSIEEKKIKGLELNQQKQAISELISEKENELMLIEEQKQLKKQVPDLFLPGVNSRPGSYHPLTQTMNLLKKIFLKQGFDFAEGPELESDYYNFEALNIPSDHPARLMHDTFYLKNSKLLLRTHTSTVQIHYMEDREPPFKMFSVGRVYRADMDPTHTPMFHQLEALVVHKHASLLSMKEQILNVFEEFFEQKLPLRLRPSFFPFTEPSYEVDIGCVACQQKGCSLCKGTTWLEVMGCGIVHPNVLPERFKNYQGYAFGLGVERLTMLKLGIPDLRLMFENHVDFLSQF